MHGYHGEMAYEFGALETSLSAAVGDDPHLLAELRMALLEGARHHADLMGRARCDANWNVSAHRLKGLAASFGAQDLIDAAGFALQSAPGDPVALRRVDRAIALLAE
jgi:HPt (histidine-containing phosphotransfer) domain-containing protein